MTSERLDPSGDLGTSTPYRLGSPEVAESVPCGVRIGNKASHLLPVDEGRDDSANATPPDEQRGADGALRV